jgi:hypothetical protein
VLEAGTTLKPTYLFCFDDCIGSGDSIRDYLFDRSTNAYADQLMGLFKEKRASMYVIAFHVDENAIGRLENAPEAFNRLKVIPVHVIDDAHRVFSNQSKVIVKPNRREMFKKFCEDVGNKLFSAGPLGWNDCQWAIAYD